MTTTEWLLVWIALAALAGAAGIWTATMAVRRTAKRVSAFLDRTETMRPRLEGILLEAEEALSQARRIGEDIGAVTGIVGKAAGIVSAFRLGRKWWSARKEEASHETGID